MKSIVCFALLLVFALSQECNSTKKNECNSNSLCQWFEVPNCANGVDCSQLSPKNCKKNNLCHFQPCVPGKCIPNNSWCPLKTQSECDLNSCFWNNKTKKCTSIPFYCKESLSQEECNKTKVCRYEEGTEEACYNDYPECYYHQPQECEKHKGCKLLHNDYCGVKEN